jgi:streptogramin lyase
VINGSYVRDSGGDQAFVPTGLTVGPDGYIYVSSTILNGSGVTNIFRVDPSHYTATLYLPSATPYPSSVGDLAFGPNSNLYFVDFGDQGYGGSSPTAIWKYNTTTHKLSVLVSSPNVTADSGIAFGPNGNLFLAAGSDGVQEYNPSTGSLIETFVANGSGGLNDAVDLTFGPDGSLYVSDDSDEILRYNGTTGSFLDVALPESSLIDGSYGPWSIQGFAVVPEPTGVLILLGGIGLLLRRSGARSA